jgi:nucleoid-associated protein YgaU
MNKPFLLMVVVFFATLALTGCVQTRAYLQDRERVDQEVPGIEEVRPAKTRKVVVVEVTHKEKPAPEAVVTTETKTKEATDQSQVVTESRETVVVHQDNFTFPKMTTQTLTQPEAVPATATASAAVPATIGQGVELPTHYTVQKDDTLQKIAKKFYNSYSKWPKIYDANKDKIKDPNFLKPGKILVIPALVAQPVAEQGGSK